jgi:hypothetical protein
MKKWIVVILFATAWCGLAGRMEAQKPPLGGGNPKGMPVGKNAVKNEACTVILVDDPAKPVKQIKVVPKLKANAEKMNLQMDYQERLKEYQQRKKEATKNKTPFDEAKPKMPTVKKLKDVKTREEADKFVEAYLVDHPDVARSGVGNKKKWQM